MRSPNGRLGAGQWFSEKVGTCMSGPVLDGQPLVGTATKNFARLEMATILFLEGQDIYSLFRSNPRNLALEI